MDEIPRQPQLKNYTFVMFWHYLLLLLILQASIGRDDMMELRLNLQHVHYPCLNGEIFATRASFPIPSGSSSLAATPKYAHDNSRISQIVMLAKPRLNISLGILPSSPSSFFIASTAILLDDQFNLQHLPQSAEMYMTIRSSELFGTCTSRMTYHCSLLRMHRHNFSS